MADAVPVLIWSPALTGYAVILISHGLILQAVLWLLKAAMAGWMAFIRMISMFVPKRIWMLLTSGVNLAGSIVYDALMANIAGYSTTAFPG